MKERSILWVFLAFVLGFSLPVCSCVSTCFLSAATLSVMTNTTAPLDTSDAVGLIQLDGTITSDTPSGVYGSGITPALVDNLLAQATADPSIKAIVVRVNSPGGSVVGSDQIYHMVKDLDLPVVFWMDEMAASGGYYIACGGDYIIAHPDSLVGSIGVISQFINAEELLDEIGVGVVVITSGPRKDSGSLFRDMTEEEQAYWQALIDEVYDGFVEIVSDGRDLPEGTVREIADGRVYTGRQALELGLVDETGLPADAIAKAAELGGIVGEPRIVELQAVPSFLDAFYAFQAQSASPTFEEIVDLAAVPSLEFRFAGP
jgi:protease-4